MNYGTSHFWEKDLIIYNKWDWCRSAFEASCFNFTSFLSVQVIILIAVWSSSRSWELLLRYLMLDHVSLHGTFLSFQLWLRLRWQRSIFCIAEFELECLSYATTIPWHQAIILTLTSRLLKFQNLVGYRIVSDSALHGAPSWLFKFVARLALVCTFTKLRIVSIEGRETLFEKVHLWEKELWILLNVDVTIKFSQSLPKRWPSLLTELTVED